MFTIDFTLLRAATSQLGIVLLATAVIEFAVVDSPTFRGDVLLFCSVGLTLLFAAIVRTKK